MTSHTIEEWFQLYERDIRSFLTYYTGSMDVEDLVQETFMIAMKKMSGFRGQSHPKTWLISIARNKVVDGYRRSERNDFHRVNPAILCDQSSIALVGHRGLITKYWNDPNSMPRRGVSPFHRH